MGICIITGLKKRCAYTRVSVAVGHIRRKPQVFRKPSGSPALQNTLCAAHYFLRRIESWISLSVIGLNPRRFAIALPKG
jgi:hypothetical protein